MSESTKPQNSYVGVISYLTWIGLIIALVLYLSKEENKNEFNAFHVRQALGLSIAGLVGGFIPVLNIVVGIFLFICWIIGFISALTGTQKEVPLLGEHFQKWFQGIVK
jgi:uncharacterized membrane protein